MASDPRRPSTRPAGQAAPRRAAAAPPPGRRTPPRSAGAGPRPRRAPEAAAASSKGPTDGPPRGADRLLAIEVPKRRRPRGWRQRLAISAGAVFTVLLLLLATVVGY